MVGCLLMPRQSFSKVRRPECSLVIQKMQRLDLTLSIRMTQFITIQEKSMIFIQFMVAKMPDSEESMDELQQKYLPIYRAIANTFVLNEKYK